MKNIFFPVCALLFASACEMETFRERGLLGVAMESGQPKKESLPDFGLNRLMSDPPVPARQAYAVCEPQARNARQGASNSYSNQRAQPKQFDCNRDYWGNYSCETSTSGGLWSGLNQGLGSSMAGKSAYSSVMASCLASYGWSQ